MTEFLPIEIVYLAIVVVAYEALRWRLLVVTHEFRVRAGCEADDWAGDSRVEPHARATLSALADGAYRPATPWLVLLALVVAIGVSPWTPRRVEISDEAEVAAKVELLTWRLILAALATSPLACLFAATILLVALLASLVLSGFVGAVANYMAVAGDRFFRGGGAGRARPA